jgi:hypothetical protein
MGRGQYICQKLLDINERAKFSWPPPEDEKARRKQDDELFERARLINWSVFDTPYGDHELTALLAAAFICRLSCPVSVCGSDDAASS